MLSSLGALWRRDRGQSAPLGLVLVMAVVIAGTGMVVALGGVAFDDTRQSLDGERAEKVLTQFDSQTALVALGNARVNRVSLARTGSAGYRVGGTAGWMNVTVTNTSSGTTKTMMNETLGSVRYEGERTVVAYQGGGVWKHANNGSVMVSPPEFYYREATLTLPLVTVGGDPSLGSRAVVTKDGPSVQHYPNVSKDDNWVNPLDNGRVNVTVHSRYYQAWGAFFEQRTDGDAVIDHENETARLTLVVPAGPRSVTNAIAATSAGGEISLTGSGSDETRTDSYNSSVGTGTYDDTKTKKGTIRSAGDISVKGNSVVNGSIASGGSVEVKGQGEVTEDVSYADSKHITGTVGGTVQQISAVQGTGPIDTVVDQHYGNLSSTNDNGNAGVPVSGDALAAGDQTLDSGRYHLDRLVLDGETLTLDTGTNGGSIAIGVRDYVVLKNDGRIEVQGNGRVRFYVDGRTTETNGNHFYVSNSGGVVDVADAQNASQLWIYGRKDFQAAIDGDNGDTQRFEGVIYAPAGTAGSSSFFIDKGELFGGVVTGTVEMDNGGAVHYDRALLAQQAIPSTENIVRLTFLHVSENPVAVTGG